MLVSLSSFRMRRETSSQLRTNSRRPAPSNKDGNDDGRDTSHGIDRSIDRAHTRPRSRSVGTTFPSLLADAASGETRLQQ
jgi:hypothetical protein